MTNIVELPLTKHLPAQGPIDTGVVIVINGVCWLYSNSDYTKDGIMFEYQQSQYAIISQHTYAKNGILSKLVYQTSIPSLFTVPITVIKQIQNGNWQKIENKTLKNLYWQQLRMIMWPTWKYDGLEENQWWHISTLLNLLRDTLLQHNNHKPIINP